MGKREALGMSEGGGGGKGRGVHLSGWCVAALCVGVLAALVAVALVVYTTVPCGPGPGTRTTPAPLPPRPHHVRLPASTKPLTYTISVVPYIWAGNYTFAGQAAVDVEVTSATSNITMHASQLNISSVVGWQLESTLQPISLSLKYRLDPQREFLVLEFPEPIKSGQYRLEITYTGVLNDALQGFYRSSYEEANETRWIATTQFQSTFARKAFPCFDEPAFKARFKISVARPSNMTAISNMPKVPGESAPVIGMPGYLWDNFTESVPMSTYLVAWTISDFDHLSDGTFTVWARKSAIEQARYALHIGPKILRYYEEYFQIPYPLPKTDMIAIPDFAAGAMENWGLITYREVAMLYQEGVSMTKQKQRVAMVISHELAHQWFGNLVTPAWWSDLWLNEGFATYVEFLGLEQVEPGMRTLDQFVVQELQNVLQLDAYKSSHPIFATVTHPSEIDEIFDSISYEKGASLIRMMEHFLTTPVFKRGLTKYLKNKAYQSATQDDLWTALTEQAHADRAIEKNVFVKEIMDTWTLRTGFPVVTVIRNYATGSAAITQKRFQYQNMSQAMGSTWWVPLSFTSQGRREFNNTKPSHWLRARPNLIIEDIQTPGTQWVIFNIKETGYYRVNYDIENWKMISSHLNNPEKYQQIGELNRAQIVDDSLNLAWAGLLNFSLALDLTSYLRHESAFIPWVAGLPLFNHMDNMINKMPIYDKFKKFMTVVVKPVYDEMGFHEDPKEEPLSIYRRVEAVKWSCYLGHQDCVKRAVTQFQNWRDSPQPDSNNPVSANMKSSVYCTALSEGGESEWNFAWERYLNANVGSEKNVLLSALGCTRETWILSRFMHWAVTENSGIRKQDAATVFSSVANNIIGQSLAFAFIRDNWTKVKNYFGSTAFTMNSIIRSTTSKMNTEFELSMLKDFTKKNAADLVASSATIHQSIENVEVNVQWMKDNYEELEKWFIKNY